MLGLSRLFRSSRPRAGSRPPAGRAAGDRGPAPPDPFDVAALAAPRIRTYGQKDGLPLSTVNALAFDRDGMLWIGTQEGAACYNGRAWRTVDMPFKARSNRIRAMLCDSAGSLWFGTLGGGLARLREGRWDVFDTSSGLPADRVVSLAEERRADGRSVLWAGTQGGGVARFDRGRWAVLGTADGLPHDTVWSLAVGRSGSGEPRLWAGTDDGLALIEGGRVTVYGTDSGLPHKTVGFLLETEGEGGSRVLWAGTNAGIGILEGGRWRVFDPSTHPPTSSVWSLVEETGPDRETVVWAATYGAGVAKLERGRWRNFGRSAGLGSEQVWCLGRDAGGSDPELVWIGTEGGGLGKLERGPWSTLDTTSGLPHDIVMAFLETEGAAGPRAVWIGTFGGGLARLEGGRWQLFDANNGLPSNNVLSLAEGRGEDGGRVIWVGTHGGGLAKLERGAWSVYDRSDGVPHTSVFCLLATEDEDGTPVLWAGTYGGGLGKLRAGAWTVYDTSSGVPNDAVMTLAEGLGERGRRGLWVGTTAGLARLEDGAWSVWDSASGLPNDSVVSVLETDDVGRRTLWVGTHGGLAWRSLSEPGSPWRMLSDATDPALPNNSVYQIRPGGRGVLYLTTNRGVVRLTPRVAEPDAPPDFEVEVFTAEDGLPDSECASGASMVDSLGRLWVGTVGGAGIFDPRLERTDRRPAPLRIERVLVNGAERRLGPGSVLRHDESDLEFEAALLSYSRESRTRYRTQLVGYDDRPSDWTPDPRRVYTNLPAGAYTFMVWGRDGAGVVSGPVRAEFTIEPAPWRTWWAYGAYAAAVAAAGYAGTQYRIGALERRRRELESIVERRTAELAVSEQSAREAREAAVEASRAKSVFLANMSHELRTPLNAVIGFSQLMERDGALTGVQRENLAIIQSSGEHLLGLINDVLSISKIEAGKLTLSEGPFDLPALLEALRGIIRGRADLKGLQLMVEVEPGLPKYVFGDEGKLRQVLINLLGNAVKFTDAGGVALRARWDEGRARFEVEDTGPGMTAEEVGGLFEAFVQTASGKSVQEGTGLGLVISRQIVQMMGGDIRVRSAPGKGTVFMVDVALPLADAAPAGRERRRVVGLEPGGPAPRVLIADDVPENRLLLSRLLGSVGFQVREVSDGEQALREWRAWRPGLIFMDMRMPVLDGREATRTIRAAEADPSTAGHDGPVRIVALTASAFEHERQAILSSGADDFVTKPYREETIFAVLERLLGVRYRYDDAAPEARGEGLTSERIAAAPAPLRAALYEALADGNFDGAARVADAIGEEDAELGRALADEIRAFRLDELLTLLEPLEPEG